MWQEWLTEKIAQYPRTEGPHCRSHHPFPPPRPVHRTYTRIHKAPHSPQVTSPSEGRVLDLTVFETSPL